MLKKKAHIYTHIFPHVLLIYILIHQQWEKRNLIFIQIINSEFDPSFYISLILYFFNEYRKDI